MNKIELLTRKEVMRLLRISHGTLDVLMKNKEIPYIKLKRKVLFRKKDIDEFLESKLVK